MKKLSLILPLLALTFLSSNVYSAQEDEPIAITMPITNPSTTGIPEVLFVGPGNQMYQKIDANKLQATLKQNGPMVLQVKTHSDWNTFLGFTCGVFELFGIVDVFVGLLNGSGNQCISGIITFGFANFAYHILKENDDCTFYLDLHKPGI